MVIRLRYKKLGGHYHCRVFTSPALEQTFAKCGDLVFDEREWPAVYAQLTHSGVQFLEDDEPPPVTMAMTLADAVLAYDAAIKACANDPEKMASFCSAEGDDLDALYLRMIGLARLGDPATLLTLALAINSRGAAEGERKP